MLNLKQNIIKGLTWKFLERLGTQGIQFIVQILMARILVPSDYGKNTIVLVFINIANIFVQSGLSTALIQKKDVEDIDYSSIFYVNITFSCVFYLILYISAPIIAKYLNDFQYIKIIRVLAIILFTGAINGIHNVIIARKMEFKKLFYSSIGASIISGAIGITVAIKGFGIWALVFQQIISQICITLILWFTIKWRPNLKFSLTRTKIFLAYGIKLMISALIFSFYKNLQSIIIGKRFAIESLGYYNRGQQFPEYLTINVNSTIQAVMFSVFSSEQKNVEKLKNLVRKSIITSSFFVFPMMVGLSAIAKQLVIILLTDKWLPCVPYLRLFCLAYAIWPLQTTNLLAINALGRSDIFLNLEVIKTIIGLIILFLSIKYGVYGIAIGSIITNFIGYFINAYPNNKLLKYSYKEQIIDVIPSLAISLIMGSIVYLINFLELTPIITIIIQIVIGFIVYIILARIIKIESYQIVKSLLLSFKKDRN